MDIDKWLEGTVETAERTRLPDQLGFPAFLYPNGKPVLERSMRRHGKRMRHSADSSILTPDKPDAAPPRREPDSAQQLEELLPSCQDSTRAPSSAHAADSDEDSGQYRRQPRRKTRPERYEAKTAKEPAKDQDRRKRKRGKQDKDAKPSRTRRKGRSGVADVVHTFHARNVPRERLTLQPRGIFKRGKASGPFRFRERGLPDLVFSEMNFLQKRREPVDEPDDKPLTNAKRRKERAGIRGEEEISAYFPARPSKRSPLVGRHTNVQPSSHRISLIQSDSVHIERARREESTPVSVRPTIEHPVPFPTIRDLRSGGIHSHTTTSLSWSESARSSPHAVFPPPTPTVHTGELNVQRHRTSRATGPSVSQRKAAGRNNPAPTGNEHAARLLEWGRSRITKQDDIDESGSSTGPGRRLQIERRQTAFDETRAIQPRRALFDNATEKSCRSEPSEEQRARRSSTDHIALDRLEKESLISQSSAEAVLAAHVDSEPLTSSTLTRLLKECNAVATASGSLDAHGLPGRTQFQCIAGSENVRCDSHKVRSQSPKAVREEARSMSLSGGRNAFPNNHVSHRTAEHYGHQQDVSAAQEEGWFDERALLEVLGDEVEGPGRREGFEMEDEEDDMLFRGEREHEPVARNVLSELLMESRERGKERLNPAVDGEFVGFWRPNLLY